MSAGSEKIDALIAADADTPVLIELGSAVVPPPEVPISKTGEPLDARSSPKIRDSPEMRAPEGTSAIL
jgi:hypothetical protein